MRPILPVILLLFSLIGTSAAGPLDSTGLSIVPKPLSVKVLQDTFTISRLTVIAIPPGDPEIRTLATLLLERIRWAGGPLLTIRELTTGEKDFQGILLKKHATRSTKEEEGYRLQISRKRLVLSAKSGHGLFYGIQTIFQLMGAEICCYNLPMTYTEWKIPCVDIRDYPRYSYRGMHLDVCRHFFPVSFIKKYIDLLAMYKMNTFHWHLTDDQGWRIEIKKYPGLTATGAWRVDHEDLPWNERPPQKQGEKATYGGFYTQDEIRDVVRYAAARYINIIPEIEMPAHCVSALAAYPQLSCTGGPFTVPAGSYWPNIDIFCAGNDSVFTFLQDVLAEVMELFPSSYIHVGGDEADKTNWKTCQKCQDRMHNEGLKDEKELQSYFIKRIEKFIISKNRKLIGWDEILEGGLAPEATVMSWRGIEGGIAAARQGHDAIMTPTSHCYLDYYQADPAFEPKAIGGFVTLRKVYSYDPTPEELSKQEARHILGVQGNLWTEFISDPSHAEYMVLPRMIALTEVGWSQKSARDWDDFRLRLRGQYLRLHKMKVNFSQGSFKVDVHTKWDPESRSMKLILGSEQLDVPIHYTLDGNGVTATSPVYTMPLDLNRNGVIRAGMFVGGTLKEKPVEMPFLYHHSIGRPVKYYTCYSYRYPGDGAGSLTDGLRGSSNHRDGLWQGFLGNDLDVVIDMGSEMPVNSVQVNFLQASRSWIFLPVVVEYSLSSDGKKYHSFNEVTHNVSQQEKEAVIQPFNFQFMAGTKARYLHVKAKNVKVCPAWHEGAGQSCWMFVDEIVVF